LSKIFAFFGKTTTYGKIFKILYQKLSSQNWSKLLCSNFMKFGRQEFDKIVRYLPDKKILLPLKL